MDRVKNAFSQLVELVSGGVLNRAFELQNQDEDNKNGKSIASA